MAQLTVHWGNSLEDFADHLFGELTAKSAQTGINDIFARRDCIVVPNRIQQAWLQHHFLFDMPRGSTPHVLANCDFPPFSLFINDWLNQISPDNQPGRPDPEKHSFSVKSTRWRIFDFLLRDPLDGDFDPLRQYVRSRQTTAPNSANPTGARDPRKCFKLAGRLSALFDQYVTYRPAMMLDWSRGAPADLPPELRWEPALWRQIITGAENHTYLALYQRMAAHLRDCGIEQKYRRVFVFAPSMMPPVHLHFFQLLGGILPVDFYLFNPAPEHDWFDRDSLRARALSGNLAERPADNDALLDLRHPLLDAYGRGSRDMAAAAIDLTGGEIHDLPAPAPPPPAALPTVLAALQRAITDCDASLERTPLPADGSIQIHQCHGKMREVQILRDQLLRCFDDDPALQPRHIQVQMPNLNDYAPYSYALFPSPLLDAETTLPFVIADRVATGESQAAEAFRHLLELADSRFTAPEILDLLRYPGIARRFHLSPDDVASAAAWFNQAGIRWGQNQRHRQHKTNALFDAATTWQAGFDRLFLGYALGSTPPPAPFPGLIPCDAVEGDNAIRLGHLARFYHALTQFADFCAAPHPLADWADQLDALLSQFFVSDNETYADIAVLRSAIRLLRTSADASDFAGAVSVDIIRDFLSGHFNETAGGADLHRNAVVFSSLRPSSTAPRRIQALLGMGDSLFPRVNDRPAYDLLRATRRMGDRSPTIEDRQAFLEVLLNARQKLLILYPAFSEEDNARAIESVAVRELTEYIQRRFAPAPDAPAPIQTFTHRLQAHNPAYFTSGSPLFSYSTTACKTAQALLQPSAPAPGSTAAPTAAQSPPIIHVGLDELISFFQHPAKHYFTKILNASPSPDGEIMLDDTELFDASHLLNWQVRQRLIDSFVAGEDDAARQRIHETFTADGLSPFGTAGAQWFAKLTQEAATLIQESPTPDLPPLADILRDRQTLEPAELVVALPVHGVTVQVTGNIHLHPKYGLVKFRPSSPTASARIATWLAHLLANAVTASAHPTSLSVLRGRNKLDAAIFHPFTSPEAAQTLLATYLDIFLFQAAPPPRYTPDTAWEFLEQKFRKNEPDAIAIDKAKGKWHNPYGGLAYSGEANAFYARLYGPDGPFEPFDDFCTAAERIILPMWRHLNMEEQP